MRFVLSSLPKKQPEHSFWTTRAVPHMEVRTTHQSIRPYAPHFHSSFSLGILLEGTTVLTCEHNTHILQAGDMVLLEPGLVHSCNPLGTTPRSYHMLYLDASWLASLTGERLTETTQITSQKRILTDSALFNALCSALKSHTPDNKQQPDTVDILRQIALKYCTLTPKKNAPPLLAQAQKTLMGTSLFPARIADIAYRSGCSRENFIRTFRRSNGLPPKAYNHCFRIEKARQLLRQGVAIADVAQETGYTDQSHFHRTFVKYVAATPHQYKANKSLFYKK